MGNIESTGEEVEHNPENINLQNRDLSKISLQIVKPIFNQIVSLNLAQNKIKMLPIGLLNLRSLVLSYNGLTEINKQMTLALLSYPQLEMLDLSLNHLTCIPNEITNMKSLKRIITFGNTLSDLNCYSSSIISLDCGQNWLEKLPKCSTITQLLNLDMNFLKEVNCNRLPVKSLVRICFRLNQISKIIPFASFQFLKVLDLGHNRLESLPDISKIAPKLRIIDISYNHLTTFPVLPKSINEIYLQMNKIKSMPDNLASFPVLSSLDLSDNKIKYIPVLPPLIRILNLNNNDITHFQQSDCSELSNFSCVNNKLQEIPVFKYGYLNRYVFISNRIKKINILAFYQNVVKIDLTDNLIDELPDEIFLSQEFPLLLHLIVARNNILYLPMTFHNSSITTLNLSCNPIRKLPNQFPITIEHISVAHCGLTNLPQSLSDCKELIELDASGNNLTQIPYMNELTLLYLSMNNIEEFPRLSIKLISLDLSCNNLNVIPENLKFRNLLYFDLSYNQLDRIPDTFCAPKLYSFKLSHNHTISYFPFSNFPLLNYLDISETKITINQNPLFTIISSDGSLNSSVFARLIQCNSSCVIAQNKGHQEAFEDAYIIRSPLINNINLFGFWMAHSGCNSDSLGAFEFTNYIHEYPLDFSDVYLSKYCDKMTKILENSSYIDGLSMGICIVHNQEKNHVLYANCGGINILIVNDNGDVEIIENTSIVPNEQYCEHAEFVSKKSFQSYLGMNLTSHYVIGKKELQSSDKWIIIASTAITKMISLNEIGEMAINTESAKELSYKISTMSRTCSNNSHTSVISYNIKLSSHQ